MEDGKRAPDTADLWGRRGVFRNFLLNSGGLIARANGTRAFVSMKNYERNVAPPNPCPSLSRVVENGADCASKAETTRGFATVQGLYRRQNAIEHDRLVMLLIFCFPSMFLPLGGCSHETYLCLEVVASGVIAQPGAFLKPF